jgi:hypothetical protein
MRLRDAALGCRIAATIPYVWLRTRLLPLPRALAGLMREARRPMLYKGLTAEAQRAQRKAISGSESLPLRPLRLERSGRCEHLSSEATRIIRLTDLLLERRVALLRPSCMLRSLVLFRFLREAGIPVQVNFGVARDGDALKGHSWLTLDGVPYAEPADPTSRFRIVYRYPC